jgi:spermidine synthase
MIPWEFLDSAKIPGQKKDLCLYRRGKEYSIRIGCSELMNSRVHASEDSLAEISCNKIEHQSRPRILIGGLGMGFTLATALKYSKNDAVITVSEIVPTVVEWNRGVLADLAGDPLNDKRVIIREIDVAQIIKSVRQTFNAILLDVDNGPEGLTRYGNDWLYSLDGLNAAYAALKPEGVLAVWSAGPDQAFPKRMRSAGFYVEEKRVHARGPRGRAHHTIWLSTKSP